MRYLPWNRLQLDSDVDGGWRVTKQEIVFSLYRTYKRKLFWAPLYQKNGAIFHGGDTDVKLTLIKNFAEQSKDSAESATIALFDLKGSHKEVGGSLEEQFLSFEYHPYEDSLEQLLEDLYKLRQEIRTKNLGSGYLEPPNRKVLVVLLDLDEDLVHDLELSLRSRELLRDLLLNSERERLYILPMSSRAAGVPGEIMRALDWSIYLGDENRGFAKGFHKNLDESYYSFSQVLIGTHYSKHEKRLAAVHHLEFTPSEWYLQERKQLQEEDAAYEKFLQALDDGTEDSVS